MRICYTTMALLWSWVSLFSQRSLTINDTVPDIQFEQVLNYSSDSIKLSDFKDKLVILDFWATWCTSCLYTFPKIDSLQTLFNDRMQLILVNSKGTRDNLQKIETFLDKREKRTGKKLNMPVAINDTMAAQLFPHRLIPHYVWVKDGKVAAITSSEAVSQNNIQDVLNGMPPKFTLKKDLDAERPIFSDTDLPADGLLNYSVFVKGRFDGLPGGDRLRQTANIIYGMAMINTPLYNMYYSIARKMDATMNKHKMIIKDSFELLPPSSPQAREEWFKEHAYTIDVIVPVEDAGKLYKKILETLNSFSGYNGRFKKIKLKCWVLTKMPGNDKLKIKGGDTVNELWDEQKPYLKNGNIGMLVKRLNEVPVIKFPVIVETNYYKNIDIDFPGGLQDVKSIRDQLRHYGLELKVMDRVIKVFVLEKKRKV